MRNPKTTQKQYTKTLLKPWFGGFFCRLRRGLVVASAKRRRKKLDAGRFHRGLRRSTSGTGFKSPAGDGLFTRKMVFRSSKGMSGCCREVVFSIFWPADVQLAVDLYDFWEAV